MDTSQLSHVLEARLRLTLAQTYLPEPLRQSNATLIAWLDALSVGPTLVDGQQNSHGPALNFEVSITADFRRLTWYAAGPTEMMFPAMYQFFSRAGAESTEVYHLDKAALQLSPDALGTWIEATAQEVDAGWYIPYEMPVATAFALARTVTPTCKTVDKLKTWAERTKALTCIRLARSVAPGNPFTELRIVLPGHKVDDWVLAGMRLFDALDISDLSDDAIGVLLNTTAKRMVASILFTAEGVVKVGLLVAEPTLDLTKNLFRLATEAQHADEYSALAELQSHLMVNGPIWAEAQQRANGFGVEYHYQLH
jgi:hypothetical protein